MSENLFKVGDMVLCISENNYITKGNVYKILEVFEDLVKVIEDGYTCTVHFSRFKLVSTRSKKELICEKVTIMNNRRKEMGYAF